MPKQELWEQLRDEAMQDLNARPSTPLSPAAQAVLDAFSNTSDGEYIEGVWIVNETTMLAAALRAAADHIDHEWSGFNCVDALYEIAAELEGE